MWEKASYPSVTVNRDTSPDKGRLGCGGLPRIIPSPGGKVDFCVAKRRMRNAGGNPKFSPLFQSC